MRSVSRATWTLLAVGLATFMTYLDNNVVNVAIPAVQRDLHLTTSGLEWVVSGYILVFASLLLAGGRLADVWGRKRVFLTGLAIFTGASLAAGLATTAGGLIAARAIQGLGAALLTPTTLAIISATFEAGRRRAAAIGIWSAVGALALAVGPLIGGLLTQYLSWEWIFFVNVPVGLVTMLLGARVISESRDPNAPHRMDLPGVITSTLALFALTYALIEGHDKGWTSPLILGSFAAAALLGLLFVRIENHTATPMVALRLFRERVFSGGLIALSLWAFGLFGIYFFTSLYLQGVLGFSATKAGAAFVPMALLMAVGAIVSERVSHRLGAHRVVSVALVVMGLGHRVGESAGRRRVVHLADAGVPADRAQRRVHRPVDRVSPRRHAVCRGGCRLRCVQRLPRGGRAVGHHGDRRGADRPPVVAAEQRFLAAGRLPRRIPDGAAGGGGAGDPRRRGRLRRAAGRPSDQRG